MGQSYPRFPRQINQFLVIYNVGSSILETAIRQMHGASGICNTLL